MHRGFPELIQGDTLLWYWNEIRSLANCRKLLQSLKQYFLSPYELRHLEFSIILRKQEVAEEFRKFCVCLRTLIRRHGSYDTECELDVLYWNMFPKFRLHIPRN